MAVMPQHCYVTCPPWHCRLDFIYSNKNNFDLNEREREAEQEDARNSIYGSTLYVLPIVSRFG